MAVSLVPLTEKELTKMRTPFELSDWWTRKNDEIYASEQGREALRLHKGLAKPFMEELWPLSKFGMRKFADINDIFFQSVIGNQPYDAIVTDRRTTPPSKAYIEITQSREGEEQYLRDREFYNMGRINPLGKPTKRGIHPHLSNIEQEAETDLKNILAAANRKTGKTYLPETSLIIFFDDRLHFPRIISDAKLYDFVRKNILCLDLKFSSLYLVGFDHVFREFIF